MLILKALPRGATNHPVHSAEDEKEGSGEAEPGECERRRSLDAAENHVVAPPPYTSFVVKKKCSMQKNDQRSSCRPHDGATLSSRQHLLTGIGAEPINVELPTGPHREAVLKSSEN